jgi:hypothetical protein
MNPLCLLTKGRTFKDMGDRSGAYNLLTRGTLPKFISARRFPNTQTRETVEPCHIPIIEPAAAAIPPIEEAPKSMIPEVKPIAPVPILDPAPIHDGVSSPFIDPSQMVKVPARPGIWRRMVNFTKDIVKRLILWPKGRSAQRPTVQTELALDKVTVLRNDLDEDNLEVVLMERKVGTSEKPLARLTKMEMTGEAWIKLTAPFRKKSDKTAPHDTAEIKPPVLSVETATHNP